MEYRKLAMDLLDTFELCHVQYQSEWVIFSEIAQVHGCTSLYHGTTLHQAQMIIKQGFHVNKHKTPTHTSPSGIYGCSKRGDCLQRVHLKRGWSQYAGESAASGWDCPVVLKIPAPESQVATHKTLANNTDVIVWKLAAGTIVDVINKGCEVHIYAPLYNHWRTLHEDWCDLTFGYKILCRTKKGCPSDIFEDNPGPNTCGRRVCIHSNEFIKEWTKAKRTSQYRCKMCDVNYKANQPISGPDY